MKATARLRSYLAIAGSAVLTISYAHAATLYWDENGITTGFGTATGGAWSEDDTSASTPGTGRWTTSSTGILAGSAFQATSDTDIFNFGTSTLGLLAGTITVNSPVDMGNLTYGSASGAIVLSGSTINLAAAQTTTVNNTTNTISSILAGAGTSFTKAGSGILVLSGANTYTGTTIISGGTLTLNRQTGTLDTNSDLTFTGTGTFNMDNVGASGNLTQTLGDLSFSAGQGTVQISRTAAFDQAITFASVARTAGATGNFVHLGGVNSATNGFILTSAPTAGTLIDKGIFFNGANYATYDAGGFVRAYGSSDTSYLAAPTAGLITASSDATSNVDLTTGNITAQTTEQANTINMRNYSITMSGSNQVLSTNGILSSGSGSATLGGGTSPRLQATALGNEIVVRVNGGSDVLTISSAIRNFGVDTGGTASALTKTGAGKLIIGAAHTLTGTINVNAGTLEYGGSFTFANNYTIGSGAVLSASIPASTNFAINGTILNNGNITKGGNGAATFSNDITGTGSFTVSNSAGTVTLSGNNTFSGGLTAQGAGGALNFLNINSNGALGTGTFTFNGGGTNFLNINVANWVNSNNNAFVLNADLPLNGSYSTADFGTGSVTLNGGNRIITNSKPVTFGGAIGQDGSARSLTKAGVGTLVLTGSNSYSGGTTVNLGTLQVGDGTTAGTMAPTGALTMGSGAFRVLGPASGGSSQTIGSLALTAATSSSITLTPGASGNTTLTITSNTLSTGAGSAVNFNYAAGTTVGGTVGNNYVVWNPTLTGGIIGGAYTVTDSGGTGFATTSGGNVVRLTDPGTDGLPVSGGSATGSYFVGSGYSTVSTSTPGSLVEALSGALAASNVTVDTTGLASGANLALDTNLLTLGAGMAFNGANPYEITGSGAGGLKAASAGGTIVLNNGNTSTVTINAPIVNTTASTLTVNGTGTTILSGANTYTGATILNGGTTRFSGTMGASAVTINNNAVAQIGATTGLTSGNTVTFGPNTTGSLQLLGNSVTIGALNSNSALGTPVITNNNGGPSVGNAMLTINSGSASSFGGVIQDGTGGGTLTLAKSGGGGLTLSGINTYSGGTILNGGTLSFGTNSDVYLGATSGGLTFNGGQIAYSDDFALNVGRTVTVTTNFALTNRIVVNGVLTGNGSITQSGSDGANFANTGNTFTGPITVAYSMTFASLGDSSNPINLGAIAGWSWSGGAKTFALRPFTSDDPGNMPISNDGSGALVIQQPLAFSGANGARTLTLGGGYTGSGNTFAGNIANGPGGPGASVVSLFKGGANIWALSGTNTYTGATTIANLSGGTLIFRGVQALPNSTSLNTSTTPSGGAGTNGFYRILDDSATPASRSGVNLNFNLGESASDAARFYMKVFVGNNSAANGGTSSSTQANSIIQLGNMNFNQTAVGQTVGGGLSVTGANGYKLQIGNVNVSLQAAFASAWPVHLLGDSGAIIVGGNVQQLAGATSANVTLNLDGTNTGNQISGNILNSADGTPRTLSVAKAGTGTWTLSGTNSHSGATTISAGKLRLENLLAVQNSSGVTMTGGSLEFGSNSTTWTVPKITSTTGTIVSDRASGSPGLGLIHVLADFRMGNGFSNFTAGPNVTNTGTAGIQVSNVDNDNGSVANPGLNPTTANLIITGNVTLGAGNTGTANFTLGGTDSVNSIAGGIVNGTRVTGNVIKSGSSTWTLSGNNTYNGTTSVNAGTLLLDMTGSGALSATSALTMGGGNFNVLGKTTGTTGQTLASLATTTSTVSTINLIPNGGTSTTLTITSATLATGAGSSLNFNYLAGGAGTTNGATIGNAIVAWNPTLTGPIIGGAYTVTDAGGSGYATTSSGNVIRYADPGGVGLPRVTGAAATNYFVGSGYSTSDSTIAGSLVESLTGAVAANTVTVDTTGLASGANLALGANKLTLSANGGMLFSGANPYTIDFTGAGGITSAASSTITLNNFNTHSSGVTLNAPILNTTATAVNFAGTGKTVLNGLNTYTGATNIGNGTLQIGSNGTLTAGTYTPAISIATGGTLQYSSSATQILSGAITGGGGLTKDTNSSILTLSSGTTAYTGPTVISAGTLSLASTSAFASPTTVNAGGTLRYAPTANSGIASTAHTVNLQGAMVYNPTGGAANFFQVTNGAVTVNATSTIDLTAGTFVASNGGLYLDGGLQGSSNVTVTSNTNGYGLVLRTTASTYSGTMTVNGTASTVSGTGRGLAIGGALTNLSNANLTINGTLELGDKNTGMGWALGATTGTALSINALNGNGVVAANMQTAASTRTLSVGNNGGGGTFSGEIANGANNTLSFIKTGAGTQTLSGPNTYTGVTNVNQGTLLINGNQSTATGLVTVASGATLGGTGTIGGTTTIQSGGIYNPGASAGTLNQSAGLTIAAGGIFDWENNTINTLGSAGTNWDVANVTGTTTISSTATTGSKLRLMFTDALTDFTNSFWDANRTWKFITGGVSAGNLFDTSNITVFINAAQQGLSNVITGQGSFATVVNGSDLDLTWTSASAASYAIWAAAFSSPALSNQAADADPDADGLENALEYVIGTDPRTPNQGGPTGSVVGTNLVYTFSRVDSSETPDVSLVVQVSTDLIDWTTIPGYNVGATTGTSSAGVSITENAAAADAITVTIPIGTDPSKFARLNVIVTP